MVHLNGMNVFVETENQSQTYITKPFQIIEEVSFTRNVHINGTRWIPNETPPKNGRPRILIAPGFLGGEKDELVISIARHLAKNSFEVFTFNYDHERWGSIAGNLLVIEVLLRHLADNKMKPTDPQTRIRAGLIGISYGGTLALLSCPNASDLKTIIALGALVNPYKILESPYFRQRMKQVSGKWLIGQRRKKLPQKFIHAFNSFKKNSIVRSLNQQDEQIASQLYKPPNDDIFMDVYENLMQPAVLIHTAETEADVVPADESRQIFKNVKHGSLHILDHPPNMSGRDLHNFKTELRQPLLDLILLYAQSLVANNNVSVLQK